jgi:hypothetical protein
MTPITTVARKLLKSFCFHCSKPEVDVSPDLVEVSSIGSMGSEIQPSTPWSSRSRLLGAPSMIGFGCAKLMLGPLLAREARGRALRSNPEEWESSSSANVTDVEAGGPLDGAAG